MIKLKIGDNYLLTTNSDQLIDTYICYMMGCFNGHGQMALGLDLSHHVDTMYDDYIKAIKDENPMLLYILFTLKDINNKKEITLYMRVLRDLILRIKTEFPHLSYKIIKLDDSVFKNRHYKMAVDIYNTLKLDNKSIVSHLSKLDEYKQFANRYKAIPSELKVISDNIKQMSKTKKVSDKIITLKDLEPLNLIDDASLEGDRLVLTIKPLTINTSEPLGKCFSLSSFENNPYLVKAAKYIYQGNHFGMVGTRVAIGPTFTPEFIETLDHRFDDMFKHNNWSSIGYLHFGKGHLCGGEFNDVIARAAEHGLDYYFMCFKQYITTANIRDYAGKKVWWYPIYDDNNTLVYCVALDIMRKHICETHPNTPLAEKLSAMTWEEFLNWLYEHKNEYSFGSLYTPYKSENVNSYSGKDDTFLLYCKDNDIDLYNELMKGAK